MEGKVLLGLRRQLVPLPPHIWQWLLHRGARADLSFMSPDHHRIRNFAVLELPRIGKPLPPEVIGNALNLELDQVRHILNDLEKHMTFLFRNAQGEVTWAYPVTVEETPHRMTFSTGEQIHAA